MLLTLRKTFSDHDNSNSESDFADAFIPDEDAASTSNSDTSHAFNISPDSDTESINTDNIDNSNKDENDIMGTERIQDS